MSSYTNLNTLTLRAERPLTKVTQYTLNMDFPALSLALLLYGPSQKGFLSLPYPFLLPTTPKTFTGNYFDQRLGRTLVPIGLSHTPPHYLKDRNKHKFRYWEDSWSTFSPCLIYLIIQKLESWYRRYQRIYGEPGWHSGMNKAQEIQLFHCCILAMSPTTIFLTSLVLNFLIYKIKI